MRIILISPVPFIPPWDEGVKNLTSRLAQYLQECGDIVHVVSPKGKEHLDALNKKTLVTRIIRFRYRLIFLSNLFFGSKEFHPDALFVFSSLSAGFGIKIMLLRLIVKRPVVVYVTGLREPLIGNRILSPTHNVLVGSPFLNRFLPSAKFVHPFLRKETGRITVAERFNRLHNTVLYLGSLQRGRGVETLLTAIQLVSRTRNVKLVIAYNGYGHYTEEWLNATVDRLGIQSNVDVRGYVDAEDVYLSADILVIPRETRQFMSFPLRILEALNMALPIIVTTMQQFPM